MVYSIKRDIAHLCADEAHPELAHPPPSASAGNAAPQAPVASTSQLPFNATSGFPSSADQSLPNYGASTSQMPFASTSMEQTFPDSASNLRVVACEADLW